MALLLPRVIFQIAPHYAHWEHDRISYIPNSFAFRCFFPFHRINSCCYFMVTQARSSVQNRMNFSSKFYSLFKKDIDFY